MAQLKYQADQNKILINKGNTSSGATSGALAGAAAASSGNTHGGAGGKFGTYTNPKFNTPYITSYKQASSYLQSKGVPNSAAASAMTESEWSRRRNSYLSTGKGGDEVKNYSSYTSYISYYVQYCLEKYGK